MDSFESSSFGASMIRVETAIQKLLRLLGAKRNGLETEAKCFAKALLEVKEIESQVDREDFTHAIGDVLAPLAD